MNADVAMSLTRLLTILRIASRYGLDQLLLQHERSGRLLRLADYLQFWRRGRPELALPAAQRLRLALEALGPIFVKFGQMLSTRRDLLAPEFADELAKLQDQVAPFPATEAIAELERVYGKPVAEVFAEFEPEPVASASVAQVHFARLPESAGGHEVAIKILRPGAHQVIRHDLGLMQAGAWLLEKLWADGRRLKPREVVAEFEKYLHDELDLMREAANCSLLRRNFTPSTLLQVPEVYWDYCSESVMVMQRMRGIPISQTAALVEAGIDLKQLSRNGVEIFFTQVFRDGFFHADMHPGNIFVAANGQYVALDFGIVGTLSDVDKNYLAHNFLAFFRRDYKRVAEVHVESGWAPAETRVEELEAAIRACCEPFFDRPLKEISFGRVLLRLFQTSRRFNIEVQPQLVLLQKTLLNIEGLGRQLDPELDLWTTAKPFLERWMGEQLGWRGLLANLKQEAPQWARLLPALPRLAHQALQRPDQQARLLAELQQLREESLRQRRQTRWALALAAVALVMVLLL